MSSIAHDRTLRGRFEALPLPNQAPLYRVAYRMTQNAADAEDLVQETYLRAFRFFYRFDEGRAFKAWIFTILKNTFISEIRRKKARPSTIPLDDEALTGAKSVHDEPEAGFVLADSIDTALDQLDGDARRAVLLADFAGYRYREIAETLGLPVGTVMSRLFDARRRLRIALGDVAA